MSQSKTPLLQFWGSRSAFLADNTSAFIYDQSSKHFFLLDCGEDVFNKLLASGYLEITSKVYVAITHMHSDHIGSLGALLEYCHERNLYCEVFFPSSHILKLWLENLGVPLHKNISVWGDETCLNQYQTLGLMQMKPIRTMHTGAFPEYGYYIKILNDQNSNKPIYYSGDYNGAEPLLDSLLNEIKENRLQGLFLDIGKGSPVHLDCNFLLQRLKFLGLSEEHQQKIHLMHVDASLEKEYLDGYIPGYDLQFVKPDSSHTHFIENSYVTIADHCLVAKNIGSSIFMDVLRNIESHSIEVVVFDLENISITEIQIMLRNSSLGTLLLYLYYQKILSSLNMKKPVLKCNQEVQELLKNYLEPMNVDFSIFELY